MKIGCRSLRRRAHCPIRLPFRRTVINNQRVNALAAPSEAEFPNPRTLHHPESTDEVLPEVLDKVRRDAAEAQLLQVRVHLLRHVRLHPHELHELQIVHPSHRPRQVENCRRLLGRNHPLRL